MGAPFATHHVLFLLWFLATTFSLNFFKVESNSNVSCNEKDKQALLSFKQGLVDSGNVLSSWSDHEDCCRWHGVRCDNNTGQVTELHLRCSRDGDEVSNYEKSLEYSFDYGSYLENLMLVPKGNELQYADNLKFVRIIDLSSNKLSGSIPVEISVLSELRFLNLSRNHLMGNIPENIGIMKELESIDLSRNHLSGEIPPSMSNLSFLSYLDLSYNDFSGRIPSSTQLQSFDPVRYIGNPQLCGAPLPKRCTPPIGESQNRTSIGKKKEDSESSSFYMGMGVGFTVGFWGVCGGLFLNRTWRHAYFKFVNDKKDWFYVTTVLKVKWLLEKLRSGRLSK